LDSLEEVDVEMELCEQAPAALRWALIRDSQLMRLIRVRLIPVRLIWSG
jgi:hypothetical protein